MPNSLMKYEKISPGTNQKILSYKPFYEILLIYLLTPLHNNRVVYFFIFSFIQNFILLFIRTLIYFPVGIVNLIIKQMLDKLMVKLNSQFLLKLTVSDWLNEMVLWYTDCFVVVFCIYDC